MLSEKWRVSNPAFSKSFNRSGVKSSIFEFIFIMLTPDSFAARIPSSSSGILVVGSPPVKITVPISAFPKIEVSISLETACWFSGPSVLAQNVQLCWHVFVSCNSSVGMVIRSAGMVFY